MKDSESHLYYLKASSGSATIQLSEGTEIELGVISKIVDVSWHIGWIDIFHDPFELEQTLQIIDVSDRLRDKNFVQIHLKELICDEKVPMPSFDPLHTIARLNGYYAVFFNTGETYFSRTWHIRSTPDQMSWSFLRNQPSVKHVGVYAGLSLLSLTTDHENRAWQNLRHSARTDLIRLIEVWHQSLSTLNAKALLSKLECATNHPRQSLVGIFGAWNNSGLAKKTNDHWEFDVPKILENYKLLPLHPNAISEFRRRGQEFKEQYET
jgi:hypothetical protein